MPGTLPTDIDRFVLKFRDVYGHIDSSRTEEALWLQAVEEGSSIAEAVREVRYEEALSHIADLFAWICGFVGKCNNVSNGAFHLDDPLSTILWLKYPDKCPRCNSNPCRCLTLWKDLLYKEKTQKERAYKSIEERARRRLGSRVRDLDEIELMFEELFGSNIMVMDIKEIAFHLLEEIGEVSEQIRELRALETLPSLGKDRIVPIKRELRRELADVFSWMVTLLIKVNYLADGSIRSVDAIAELLREKGYGNNDSDMPRKPLLRVLVLKYYSSANSMICRSCHKKKCDISVHIRRNRLYSTNESGNGQA